MTAEAPPSDGSVRTRGRRGPSVDAVVIAVTVAATIVFWLVSTSWRPWNLFERAGFGADFYDEQAQAFLRGELAVDPEVASIEGFVVGGRTYLYYGPFLSIVRVPFMLAGDLFVGRLVRVSMILGFATLCWWSARLCRVARRVVRSVDDTAAPDGDERWAIGIFVAAVACSPALFAAGWITVYHETELWALTLAVITVALVAEWSAGGYADRRLLVLAGLAALSATLTRAPIGAGVSLVLVGCGAVLAWRSRGVDGERRLAVTGVLAVALGTLPVVAHMIVNWAKFGTLLSVPGDRQVLSILNEERADWFAGNGGSFFSPRFLPTTIVQYLRPDALAFERLVPGIRFGPLATDRGSYPVESITPSSSLTATATLLLALAAVGVFWLVRHRAATWLLMVVATTIGAVPTFLIGFIANRYLIDMLPPLIVGGAIGTWQLAACPWRRTVRVAASALAVFGLWANASLATWTLEYRDAGFTEFRYDVDRSVFGSPSPGLLLVDADGGTPVPRDGIVGVDPACRAVYIAEQGRWLAIDRVDGELRTVGTFDPSSGPAVIASGVDWLLELDRTSPSQTTVRVLRPGARVEERLAATPGTEDTLYEVVVDPNSREFFVRLDGLVTLLPGDLGPIDTDRAERSGLCEDLLGQLG